MNVNHKVSIIIPLYNSENYIRETIKSVLDQTYQDFEIIIIDDCSIDRSLEIVQAFTDDRIKVFQNEKNMGIAYTRNRGLQEGTGDFIALLDDDDIAINDRLEKQISFLQNHPDVGVVGGNAQWIDENGDVIRDTIKVIEDPLYIKMILMFRNIYNNSEMTFRKSIIDKYDIKYSDNCLGMEDFEFWTQCSRVSRFACIPDLVLKRHMIKNSETARVKREQWKERKYKYWEIQKKALNMEGFVLSIQDENILLNMFDETGENICGNSEELQQYYNFMRNLISQARNSRKEYCFHMESWFRELLIWQLQHMEHCCIWD